MFIIKKMFYNTFNTPNDTFEFNTGKESQDELDGDTFCVEEQPKIIEICETLKSQTLKIENFHI